MLCGKLGLKKTSHSNLHLRKMLDHNPRFIKQDEKFEMNEDTVEHKVKIQIAISGIQTYKKNINEYFSEGISCPKQEHRKHTVTQGTLV